MDMAEKRPEFPIEQQIRNDVKEAMKARDQLKIDTLRMALNAIKNVEVARTDTKNPDYRKPLTEEDCMQVLEQEVKKRMQAIELYNKGGRAELAEKEQKEADILRTYTQASQMSDADLQAAVQSLIDQHGKEFRKVMPLAMKELKEKADGYRVRKVVEDLTR
jgi:uncharacterized protein YqeY